MEIYIDTLQHLIISNISVLKFEEIVILKSPDLQKNNNNYVNSYSSM
jgi:hypothetical protein